MGFHRQPDHSASQPSKAGPALTQRVVEFLRATPSGLVFWSRHQLELAAELQLRVHPKAMLGLISPNSGKWMTVRGFVVECKPARREDGTVGFEISVVFESSIISQMQSSSKKAKTCPYSYQPSKDLHFGLN